MYSNKQLKALLQSKKKRATALKKRAMKGGNTQRKYGRKRNKVMVSNTTQKIFPGVYNANKPLQSHTPINLRGGQYSLPVGDIISNEQHRGIINAQNKLVSAWRRRNNYVKF